VEESTGHDGLLSLTGDPGWMSPLPARLRYGG
jgi:hypothetical protein